MRFTIKLKLAGAFAAILLLSAAAAWVGTNSLATIDENLKSLLAGPVTRLGKVTDIQATFLDMLRFDKNLVLASDASEMKAEEEASRQKRQELQAKLDDYSKIVGAVNREKFEELRRIVSQYLPLQEKIYENGRHDTNAEALALAEKEGHTDEFVSMLQPLRDRLLSAQSTPETVGALTALTDILVQLRDIEIRQRDSILASTDAEIASFNQKIKATISAVEKQRDAFRQLSDAQGRPLADQFFERFEKWAPANDRIMFLSTVMSKARAAGLSMGEGKKITGTLAQEVDGMVVNIKKDLEASKAEAEGVYNSARQMLLTAIAVAMLVGIAAALWIALSISRGLSRAAGLANEVAVGDLDQEVTASGNDEIKDLIDALNRMTANLRATAKVADAIAGGDLTVDAKPLSDKDKLGISLKHMVEKLRVVVSDSLGASANVSSGSQEMSASAEQLSSGATEQAAAAEEASSSMEQMAANIKQNADNASQTEKIARQSAADAESERPGRVPRRHRDADHRREDHHRAGDRAPDRSLGSERGGRGGPRRRARPVASRWLPPRCGNSPSAARRRRRKSARFRARLSRWPSRPARC